MVNVKINATQGASLWETTGDTTIAPKGGKLVPVTSIDGYDDSLALKVDKEDGKGLSTNDFTDDFETKLTDLPTNSDLTTALGGKVDVVSGKELSTNDFTDALEAKLNGIEESANNYSHPANHSPSIITQDSSNRFVTDTEKSTWNGKQDALVSATNIKSINGSSILGSGDLTVSGSGVKSRIYVPKGADEGYDDEFDDGSITGWTNIDVTSYENEWYEPTGLKGLSCYVPSGKGSYKLCGKLKSKGALTPPFYIETAIKIGGRSVGYPSAGLLFSSSSSVGSGSQISVGIHPFHNKFSYATYSNFTSRISVTEIDPLPYAVQDYVHIRLSYVSSNTFSCYFSIDGVVWYPAFENISYSMTPTHMGVMENSENNSTYPFMVNYGYFRARSGSHSNG